MWNLVIPLRFQCFIVKSGCCFWNHHITYLYIYILYIYIYMYSIVRPPSKNSGWDGDGQSSKARARQDGVDWTLESKAKWRRWCRALQQWSSPQWIKLVGGLEHEWIIFHFIYGRIFHIVNSRSTIYIYLVGGFKDLLFSIIYGIILPIDELIFLVKTTNQQAWLGIFFRHI